MNVKSLGYRTDLIFPAFDGQIVDRGHYLVVRTPINPSFFWGNFLLFARPPQQGDFIRWSELFALEIGTPPETVHQVFGWDSPDGKQGIIEPFLEAGFWINRSVVMTSNTLSLSLGTSDPVSIRALITDTDWDQAVENQVICREAEFEETEYRVFKSQQMARYRRMAAAGHGNWYGAFMGDRLVADLGIFHRQGVGRYQSVETHPDFRRRGIAGAMIVEAGRQAMSDFGLQTLVIVAEQESKPAHLYQSLGFQPTEHLVALERW